ncbi:MAG TPA: fasciclin domain-containing protein [Xanthomonadales bacterium]|nr:fasciclin domain-containing protein [Xanthomonadales bacterium]
MYKSTTSNKLIAMVAIASATLLFAGNVAAKKDSGKGPGKPGEDNIVQIAMDNGNFEYLLGAVGCFTDPETGENPIVDLLTGDDRLTLFAPTDQAFINLQNTLNDLWGLELEETAPEVTCAVDMLYGEGTLFTILAYHLTEGRRFSNSIFNQNNSKDIEMLAGGYVTSTTMPSAKLITNISQMVSPVLDEDGVTPLINIRASNGVIHVIDTVMLPIDPTPPEE